MGRLLALEVLVASQLDRGFGQAEADVVAALSTRGEGFTLQARCLMAVAMHQVVHDVVDSGLWNFLSGSERVADGSHDERLAFVGFPPFRPALFLSGTDMGDSRGGQLGPAASDGNHV